MPRCPNCSYMLVLLERRRKYKCAKCGNLYPQKDIELKDFKKWNLRQRISDKENIKKESKPKGKRPVLTEEERIERAKAYMKKYYTENKEKFRERGLEYRKKNRAKERERERIWRENNQERYNARKREYYRRNKERLNKKSVERRRMNFDKYSCSHKLGKLKKKQKQLAVRMIDKFLKV